MYEMLAIVLNSPLCNPQEMIFFYESELVNFLKIIGLWEHSQLS